MTHGLIFNKFNEKLNIQKNFEEILFPEMEKIYYKSNPNNILKVEYLDFKKISCTKSRISELL